MLFDPKWGTQSEVKLEPWREHLLNAADYIEKHGWCQTKISSWGRVCSIGAMLHIDQEGGLFDAWTKFGAYVGGSVVGWNDAPGRTKEQVLFAMRDCARNG